MPTTRTLNTFATSTAPHPPLVELISNPKGRNKSRFLLDLADEIA
jgi:hypothetical protein